MLERINQDVDIAPLILATFRYEALLQGILHHSEGNHGRGVGIHRAKGPGCHRFIEEDLDTVYDWSADVMSEAWSPVKAKRKLKLQPGTLVCDALLGQQVFAGVGNIIKNEVCFRIHTPRKRSRRATNPAVEPNGKGSKKLQL